ncbi:MAG: ferrous iron transport protein B [Acidobacteriota bacterium]|nr:ferrous iron transport protein B [Acidobacteriota bacterium]
MSQHAIDAFAERPLLLVGNPNVGKSLLFTRLTNRYVTVSNYPGTTVEMTRATATIGEARRTVIDTPGINSLLPQSQDEVVARDLLVRDANVDVLQVGDITNLRRTLLLALQLSEYAVPFVIALNMADELGSEGCSVDIAALSVAIGVPVVVVSALRRWNIGRLKQELSRPATGCMVACYPPAIEEGLSAIIETLCTEAPQLASRGVALSILAGDATLAPLLRSRLAARTIDRLEWLRRAAEGQLGKPMSIVIVHSRVAAVDRLLVSLEHAPAEQHNHFREKLGRLCMHPLWGAPILLVVLVLAWLLVGKLGAGTLVDLMQKRVFEGFINPWATRAVRFVLPRFAQDLFVGPYGIITMALTYAIAIILPVVVTFFTFFGLLEDSGYLPRLAVLLHRGFRRIGLNGKAVLPMVLGLGCDTMATLTTRILDSKKEAAIVTLLLALGVPCSAQLGVIMAMLAPLGLAATVIWLTIIGGTIMLAGWAASRVIPGERGDFVLEIPPMRVPRLSNILIKVAARTEWYLKEAVPLFIVGTLMLYVLDATGALIIVQRLLRPLIVGGLGLPAAASNSFVIGFLRRDYGAAGLYAMQRAGQLSPNQVVIALTVITLFIPCIANLLVMLKERGARMGWAIVAFIVVYSFGIGALMNFAFRLLKVSL